jgi:Flp pilus assembly protein TadB
MSKKLLYIVAGIALVSLLLLAFLGGRSYQKRETSTSEEYLKQQIVEAQAEAEKWKGLYDNALEKESTLLVSVDSLENKINELKKNNVQKITIVKSYSNPELEQFFSDRYGSL